MNGKTSSNFFSCCNSSSTVIYVRLVSSKFTDMVGRSSRLSGRIGSRLERSEVKLLDDLREVAGTVAFL